jgi:hypothetical protein
MTLIIATGKFILKISQEKCVSSFSAVTTVDTKMSTHMGFLFKINNVKHNIDQKYPIPLLSTNSVCILANSSYNRRKLDLRIYCLHFTPPGGDKSAKAVIR